MKIALEIENGIVGLAADIFYCIAGSTNSSHTPHPLLIKKLQATELAPMCLLQTIFKLYILQLVIVSKAVLLIRIRTQWSG
jgi:hypothetical protein